MNSMLVLRHLTFFNCRRNLTQLAAAAGPRLDRCFGAPSCDEKRGHGGFHSHEGIPTWLIHIHVLINMRLSWQLKTSLLWNWSI